MPDPERNRVFEGWIETHKAILFKVARVYGATHSDREDLFQEIWLHITGAAMKWRPTGPFRSWLFQLVRNRCFDHFRAVTRESGGAGKRLDFLTQEVFRELNTLGAKCRNAEMTREILNHEPPLEQTDRTFHAAPLGWAIHGSENGWHRRTGDYARTVELLCAAGAKLPEAEGEKAIRVFGVEPLGRRVVGRRASARRCAHRTASSSCRARTRRATAIR